MKTISAGQNTLRVGDGWEVTYVAHLTVEGTVIRYSTRALTLEGNEYSPRLLDVGSVSRPLGYGLSLGEGIGRTDLTFENIYDGEYNLTLIETANRLVGLDGRPVRVGMLFDAVGAVEADIVWLARYRVDDLVVERQKLMLRCVDALEGLGAGLIGRVVRDLDFPEADESTIGSVIPIIFGSTKESRLLGLEVAEWSRLDGGLTKTDSVFVLQDVSDFPDWGTAWVGNEKFFYSAKSNAARTLGTVASPVWRDVGPRGATEHPSGAPVMYARSEWVYVVADHPCKRVSNVQAATRVVAASEYTVEERVLDGVTTQAVVFPGIPPAYESASGLWVLATPSEIRADVQGVYDSVGGDLAQNPAVILRDVLAGPSVGYPDIGGLGLTAGELDTAGFTVAEARLSGAEDLPAYDFGRRIASSMRVRDVIETLGRDARSMVVDEDGLRMVVMDSEPDAAVFVLDSSNVTAVSRKAFTDLRDVYNRVGVTVSEGSAYVEGNDLVSQAGNLGVRRIGFNGVWLAAQTDDLAAAQDLANFWAVAIGQQEEFVTLTCTPEALVLERNDSVVIDLPMYGLGYETGFVHSLERVGPIEFQVTVRLRSRYGTCWSYDWENAIVVAPNGLSIVCFVGADPVWSLDSYGNMDVITFGKNNLTLTAAPVTAVGYDTARVYFTAPANGSPFTPFLYSGASGTRMALGDELVEGQDLTGEAPRPTCVAAGVLGKKIYFTVADKVVGLYDRDTRRFKIAGSLREGRY